MSTYQEALHKKYEFTPVKIGVTVSYKNFYIHSITFTDGSIIHKVSQGKLHYYSKSLEQVKRKIRAYHNITHNF